MSMQRELNDLKTQFDTGNYTSKNLVNLITNNPHHPKLYSLSLMLLDKSPMDALPALELLAQNMDYKSHIALELEKLIYRICAADIGTIKESDGIKSSSDQSGETSGSGEIPTKEGASDGLKVFQVYMSSTDMHTVQELILKLLLYSKHYEFLFKIISIVSKSIYVIPYSPVYIEFLLDYLLTSTSVKGTTSMIESAIDLLSDLVNCYKFGREFDTKIYLGIIQVLHGYVDEESFGKLKKLMGELDVSEVDKDALVDATGISVDCRREV